jgi:hypothetical protein
MFRFPLVRFLTGFFRKSGLHPCRRAPLRQRAARRGFRVRFLFSPAWLSKKVYHEVEGFSIGRKEKGRFPQTARKSGNPIASFAAN